MATDGNQWDRIYVQRIQRIRMTTGFDKSAAAMSLDNELRERAAMHPQIAKRCDELRDEVKSMMADDDGVSN